MSYSIAFNYGHYLNFFVRFFCGFQSEVIVSKVVSMVKEYKKPWWVWIIIVIYGLLIYLAVINPIGCIFVIFIGFVCGNQCVSWATQIKKSKNVAFFIGFVSGLSGLLGYWIYYKIKIRKI